MSIPIPPDDELRLKTLHEYQILDTLPEACFDHIISVAAAVCGTPAAMFTLVDRERIWIKSGLGWDTKELSRSSSFCTHAIADDEFLCVDDATTDERFADNEFVVGDSHLRFYAGVPVHAYNKQPLGTLCVVDVEPRRLPSEHQAILESLAREIEAHLDVRRNAQQREDLIVERAILTQAMSQDAETVLSRIDWSLGMLRAELGEQHVHVRELSGAASELAQFVQRVGNVDHAMARPLSVTRKTADLSTWFNAQAAQFRQRCAAKELRVEASFELEPAVVTTDTSLLDRIVYNLQCNAIEACPPGALVSMALRDGSHGMFEIEVADTGPGIPADVADHMYKPYFTSRPDRGVGLGLAICDLAAKALGGSIRHDRVDPQGARFTVSLPRG